MDDDRYMRDGFAVPGGNSALRASSKRNPRNLPCPTCKHWTQEHDCRDNCDTCHEGQKRDREAVKRAARLLAFYDTEAEKLLAQSRAL